MFKVRCLGALKERMADQRLDAKTSGFVNVRQAESGGRHVYVQWAKGKQVRVADWPLGGHGHHQAIGL